MEVDKAKEIFEEIVELCYQTENQRLIEIIEPIYRDIETTNNLNQIILLAEDFQVNLNEMEFLQEEEEVKDMHEMIEKLSE